MSRKLNSPDGAPPQNEAERAIEGVLGVPQSLWDQPLQPWQRPYGTAYSCISRQALAALSQKVEELRQRAERKPPVRGNDTGIAPAPHSLRLPKGFSASQLVGLPVLRDHDPSQPAIARVVSATTDENGVTTVVTGPPTTS
jgi:hypothetical protein